MVSPLWKIRVKWPRGGRELFLLGRLGFTEEPRLKDGTDEGDEVEKEGILSRVSQGVEAGMGRQGLMWL